MNNLMRCPKCKTAKENDKKFCDECGTKLEQFADANGIWKPVGLWCVTTQGDEEGKSTKQLGVHEGHIVDIARALSAEAFYDLNFRPMKALDKMKIRAPRANVHVQLDIDSGTWEMEKEPRMAYFRTMIKDRDDVRISASNYYGAVVFNFLDKKEAKRGSADKTRS